MELQKRRFLRGTFDFSPQGIGAAADFVGQGLEALGADPKTRCATACRWKRCC